MKDAVGQRRNVAPRRAVRRAAHQDMDLLQHDGHADAGQHGVHHHRCNGQRGACHPAQPEDDLQDARAEGHQAQHLPTDLFDQSGDHHGEAGGRAAHLNRRPAEQSGDNATHHRGNQTGHQRSTGGNGDPQRQGQRYQEDDERRGEVMAQVGPHPLGSRFGCLGGVLDCGAHLLTPQSRSKRPSRAGRQSRPDTPSTPAGMWSVKSSVRRAS